MGSLVRLFSFLQSLSDILSWDPRRFFPYFSNANDFSREVFVPGYLRMLFFSPYNSAKYITETKTHYYYYWKSSILLSVPIFWVTGIAYFHWFPAPLNIVSPSFFHWDLHCSFTSPSVFDVLSNRISKMVFLAYPSGLKLFLKLFSSFSNFLLVSEFF